jgi:hypothetical protein
LLKLFGPHIDSQKRQVFDLRNDLRAGRRLSISIDEIGFGDLQGCELFELTQSRSQTQGSGKADKPDSAPRLCLARHQEARRWECPGFRVKFGLAGADGMPGFCGASIATDPRSGNAVAHDHHQPGLLEALDTRNLLSLAAKLDILDVPGAPATW